MELTGSYHCCHSAAVAVVGEDDDDWCNEILKMIDDGDGI